MLRTVLSYLAADVAQMAVEVQAQCLLELEQLDAVKTATRARVLGTFTAAQAYSADGDYSPRSWLIHTARITRGAATIHLAWARRAAAHPQVAAMSESYARRLCEWTDKLPPDCRDAADAILAAAARAGTHLEHLAALAAEMYVRSLPDPDGSDDQPDESFEDRRLTVETTFQGAGVISGDVTPECAAVVTAVLESLSAPAGGGGHPVPGAALSRCVAGGDAVTVKMHHDLGHIDTASRAHLRDARPTGPGASAWSWCWQARQRDTAGTAGGRSLGPARDKSARGRELGTSGK